MSGQPPAKSPQIPITYIAKYKQIISREYSIYATTPEEAKKLARIVAMDDRTNISEQLCEDIIKSEFVELITFDESKKEIKK